MRNKPLIVVATSFDLEKKLVRLSEAYLNAVRAAGGQPVMVYAPDKGECARLTRLADGLLLAGGDDVDPARYGQTRHEKTEIVSKERDESEAELLASFRRAGKPTLAICRGAQVVNVALGGTLHQHVADLPQTRHEHAGGQERHTVTIEKDCFLHPLFGAECTVNSYHHQAADTPGSGLSVVAYSDDGLIEALEAPGVWAVQWHPELMEPAHRDVLFGAFVDHCAGNAGESRYYEEFASPVGTIAVEADGQGITALRILAAPTGISAANRACPFPVRERLDEYLAGKRQAFDLPLHASGTEFQQQVWQELLSIPFGETRTYAQLAAAVGKPGATRAVGSAVGRNPIAILIPCHRAMRADGGMGGFAYGVDVKEKLLRLEGRM